MNSKTLLAVSLLLLFSLPALAAPKVVTSQKDFDFGEIFQGEKVSHTFSFSNVGDTPLLIDKVRSSCGCTAAIPSKKTLQPGESGEIKATFDSSRFRGPIAKKIYLYSNDPQQPTFTFALTASVKELLLRTPYRISAGPLPLGKPHSDTIELTNQGTVPLKITGFRVENKLIQVSIEPETLPPGGRGRLNITVTPDKQRQRINSYIILQTDSPLLPELRIPVFYLVDLKG